jgi:hypothetical protein
MSIRRVVKSKDLSPQTVVSLGIAIHSNSRHIGLLYRIDERESVRILHLKWNRDLESETPSSSYVCWVRPEIGADRACAIAALCRRIWKQNQKNQPIFNAGSFKKYFNESGNRIKSPATSGLTCASFVLSVFDAAKYPLIFDDQWPPAGQEDEAVLDEYFESLKKDPNTTKDDLDAYQAERGNVRFRPLEIAGASTSDTFPAKYAFSFKMAKEIESFLPSCSIT